MAKRSRRNKRLSFSQRRQATRQAAINKQTLPTRKVANRRVPVISIKLLNRVNTASKPYRAGLETAAVSSLSGPRNQGFKLNQQVQTSLAGKPASRDLSRKSRAQHLVQRTHSKNKKEQRDDQKDTTYKLRLRGVGYDDHYCKKRPDSQKAGEISAKRRASGNTSSQEIRTLKRKTQFNVWC